MFRRGGYMKRVAIITMLFLFVAVSAFAGSYEDGVKAYKNKDYKTAFGIFSKEFHRIIR